MGQVLGKSGLGAELNHAPLDTLCQERKVEHGQSTRAEVVSQIEEITRSCGAHSDKEEEVVRRPYGVEHEGQALDIWSLILEKVTDSSEIGNLWNVCKMFQGILRHKYIQTRLPEVVHLILKKRPHYLLLAEDYANFRETEAKTSGFLKLRLLCKQVNNSLEEITASEKCDQAQLYLATIWQLDGILETLGRNPSYAATFFPNYIYIEEHRVLDDLEPFQQRITSLLQLVGHRISFFYYYSYLDMQRDVYICARTWAGFMPNLKTISVEQRGLELGATTDEPAPRLEDVEPFPNLPLLQSYEGGDMFAAYVQRILEAGPGIKDLELEQYETVWEHSPQVVQNLVNLTSIGIQPYDSLLEHLHLPWKLKKIEFCFAFYPWFYGQRLKIPSGRLFAFLKQFEETLEDLTIQRVEVVNSCEYLELRNLKTLKMEFHKSFDNLNLLLYAEKLETLRVKIPGNVMWYLSPSKKFSRILEESFLGRSIWDVFPYLKKLQLCTSNYYRPNPEGPVLNGEMFEQYRRAQGVILKRNATFN